MYWARMTSWSKHKATFLKPNEKSIAKILIFAILLY